MTMAPSIAMTVSPSIAISIAAAVSATTVATVAGIPATIAAAIAVTCGASRITTGVAGTRIAVRIHCSGSVRNDYVTGISFNVPIATIAAAVTRHCSTYAAAAFVSSGWWSDVAGSVRA